MKNKHVSLESYHMEMDLADLIKRSSKLWNELKENDIDPDTDDGFLELEEKIELLEIQIKGKP